MRHRLRENAYGALLVFKPGTTREEAEAVLAALREACDELDVGIYDLELRKYDPRLGGPVWYTP
jgi:hypothetical protein